MVDCWLCEVNDDGYDSIDYGEWLCLYTNYNKLMGMNYQSTSMLLMIMVMIRLIMSMFVG